MVSVHRNGNNAVATTSGGYPTVVMSLRVPMNADNVIAIVFALLLAALVGALILRRDFRDAVLGGQGEASLLGVVTVKGVAIVLLCGLLIGGILLTLRTGSGTKPPDPPNLEKEGTTAGKHPPDPPQENLKKAEKPVDIFAVVQAGTAEDLAVQLGKNGNLKVRDPANKTLLMLAAERGHLGMVKLLEKHGANVNAEDPETALGLASTHGFSEIVEYLLEKGADPNLPDVNRTPPLMPACRNGHTDIVRSLLKYGAQVNWQNVNGCTPLMDSTDSRKPEIVSLLICYGAEVDTVDHGKYKRRTALMWAAEKGEEQMVRVLLYGRPDISLATVDGRTAIDLARQSGRASIIKMLETYQEEKKKDGSNGLPVAQPARPK
jgi:ankyrin repeat protein